MTASRPVVLLTGSSGRIGSALIARLGESYEIVALDQPGPPHPKAPAHDIHADMESDDSVNEALRQVRERFGSRIASVFHLAAYYSFSGDPDPRYTSVNVEGTRRLLRALQGFEVEQFVYSSTILVHAPTEPGTPIREDSPLQPKWEYPQSKLEAEQQLRREAGKIPWVILRLAGVYNDEGDLPALAQQIARIHERKLTSRVFPGDLSHGQSALHLDDLVELCAQLVDQRARIAPQQVLLAGEPDAPSYGELQHELGRLLHGEPWETQKIPKTVAQAGAWLQEVALPESKEPFIKHWMVAMADDHYELDVSKARELLNWTPQHRLIDTLPRIVAALKRDPEAWYKSNHLGTPPQTPPPSCEEQKAAPGAQHDKAAEGNCGAAMSGHAHGGKSAEGKCGGKMSSAEGKCGGNMSSQHGGDAPSEQQMLLQMHHAMLWPHYVNAALGLWLITSPFLLGYLSLFVPDANVLRTFEERGLSLPRMHNLWMSYSDVLSGVLVLVFSLMSADPRRRYSWTQWANAAVGFWLLFAPLLFWTPLPEAYANDTLIGALIITFSVLVPMMPGMSMAGMMGGRDIPPGWNYTPSSFVQRFPIAALALLGFFLSRYMTAWQLGHNDIAWDPFFQDGQGTMTVIGSDMSKTWPIADAGVGAVAYALEVLMAVMGDKKRWRTMPWMVLAFGVLVVPLGSVSIFFIVVQPIVIGTWCFLCLVAALAMVLMIPYSLDELVASGQFLVDAHRRGKPFWRTFWMGDAMQGGCVDRSKGFAGEPREILRDMWGGGVTWPWTLLASIALGVALMFTRLLFGSFGRMADSDHLVGAMVVTFSVMATAEVGRALRFINIPFGLWLVVAPWLLNGAGSALAVWSSVLCGLALIALAIPKGSIRNRYGSWDRYIV